MKIVMVGPFAIRPKGTVGVRILPLARELRAKGHQVSIVLPPYDNRAESGCTYRIGDIPVHNVRIPNAPSPMTHILTTRRLVSEVRKLAPDLIHVFKPRGDSGLAAMSLILQRSIGGRRIPIVIDTDDWEGRGGFYDYWLKNKVYPKYQLDFACYQEKWLPRHADAVTVASRTLQTQIWGLGIPSEKVFYVPNGVHDIAPVGTESNKGTLPKNLGLSATPTVLLYTRFLEYDVEDVITIFGRIRHHVSDARLIVIGKGDLGEERKLSQLAQTAGMGSSIILTGWVEPEMLPAYLELGDVAIYPFNDTLLNRAKCPGKLVELMSLGKAIVAHKVGQIAEYIEHQTSGILIEPGDHELFAQSVISLLLDANTRERIAQNAKSRIWSKFTWNRLVLNVEKAYQVACSHDKR